MKRFDGEEGSQVFSEAQEKWLGGADRTDPYILARMRKAVPDEPKAEPKVAPTPTAPKNEVIDMRTNKDNTIDDATRQRAMEYVKNQQTKPTSVVKPVAPKTVTTSKTVATSNPVDKTDNKESSIKTSNKVYNDSDSFETKVAKLKGQNVRPKSESEIDFDAAVEKARLENATKPYSKKQGFFEGLKDKYGGKKVAGAEPRMAKGGTVKRTSASKRGDGIATKGHTRGKYC